MDRRTGDDTGVITLLFVVLAFGRGGDDAAIRRAADLVTGEEGATTATAAAFGRCGDTATMSPSVSTRAPP